MKLIKPYYEIIEQQPGEVGMLKHIEAQGRTAWKSEDRITDDSYIKFNEMLKGVNHGSVLEHGTVYLEINNNLYDSDFKHEAYLWNKFIDKYKNNKYSKIKNNEYSVYVTTNYRVLFDNNWLDDLKYQCEPTKFHEKRVTVRLVIDRGVSHEFVRHRTFSFTQESTRYCNYTKDKFDNEITYIIPPWMDKLEERIYSEDSDSIYDSIGENLFDYDSFLLSLASASQNYERLISLGWKPQQARSILPNSLKTELIMTGFISDWKHFFMLRCAPGAHPQAQEIAIPLEQEFKHLGLL